MKNVPPLSIRTKMSSFILFFSFILFCSMIQLFGSSNDELDGLGNYQFDKFENTIVRFLQSDPKFKSTLAYQNAEKFFKDKEYVFALFYYNYLAAQPEKINKQILISEVNNKRVLCFTKLHRYDDAINIVKQNNLNQTSKKTLKIDAYLKLMNLFSLKEDIDSAIHYKKLIEKQVLPKEYQKHFIVIKLQIIKTCIKKKNYNIGLRLLNDLKEELVLRKESKFLAKYYHLYALIYLHNNDLKNARLYFEKGRNTASKLRDLQLITEIILDEVSLNLSTGNFKGAEKGIQKLHTYSRYVPQNLALKIVVLEAKLQAHKGNEELVFNILDSLSALAEDLKNKIPQSEIIKFQDAILTNGRMLSHVSLLDEREGSNTSSQPFGGILLYLVFFFLLSTLVLIFLLLKKRKVAKNISGYNIGSFILDSLQIKSSTDDLILLFEKTPIGENITKLCPEKRQGDLQKFLKSDKQYYHFSELILKNEATQPVVLLKKIINDKVYCYVFMLPVDFQAKNGCDDDIEMLRKLNKTKNKLFSMIGHELRNAIGNSKAVLETLSEDLNMYGEENLQQVIDMLKNASIKAYEMLENLLYWSRIQRQEMKYQPESLSVKMLLSEIMNSLSPQAKDKNIEIENAIYDDSLLYVDEQMTLLVLSNILSNAIKFTNEKGKVRISGKQVENKFIFEISDNGVGIKDEDMPKIFDENNLFSTYGTAGEKGLGIGIFICSKLVEEHGGNLTIESKNNEGTVITFSFPVSESL